MVGSGVGAGLWKLAVKTWNFVVCLTLYLTALALCLAPAGGIAIEVVWLWSIGETASTVPLILVGLFALSYGLVGAWKLLAPIVHLRYPSLVYEAQQGHGYHWHFRSALSIRRMNLDDNALLDLKFSDADSAETQSVGGKGKEGKVSSTPSHDR